MSGELRGSRNMLKYTCTAFVQGLNQMKSSNNYINSCMTISSENFNDGCFYCGRPAAVWDHIVPKYLLGEDEIENLVPSCIRCNSSKGKKSLFQWRKDIIKYRLNIEFETPSPHAIRGKRYLSMNGGFIKFESDDGIIIIDNFQEYTGHCGPNMDSDEYAWIQAITRIFNRAS